MFTACFGFLSTGSGGGGGSQTLAQTLSNGNTTNENSILSNNSKSATYIFDDYIQIFRDEGFSDYSFFYADADYTFIGKTTPSDDGIIGFLGNEMYLTHSNKINISCSQVFLNSLTGDTLLALDSTKKIQSLLTTTYPSLTEISYVKGVTSSIQNQLNSKAGYEMQTGQLGAFAPVDSTSYYFGNPISATTSTAVAGRVNFYFPYDGTVKRIDVYVMNAGTGGTTEASSVFFRLNNTTDTLVTNAINTNTGVNIVVKFTGTLNIPVTTVDYFELRWDTPAWATNPGSVRMCAIVYID